MQARLKFNSVPALIIVVVLFWGMPAINANLQNSRSIQTTGVIFVSSSSRIGIYVNTWNFREYNASTVANTFDLSQSWWVGPPPNPSDPTAKMDQVRSLNPNFKTLVYRDSMGIYDYWPEEWNYANSQGWLLKDANGKCVSEAGFPSCYVVDVTNVSYQRWLGAKVESWLTQYPYFDGVYVDNGLKYSEQLFADQSNSTPIDPSTGTYFTDQEIWDGYAGILNAVIDGIGTNKLVVPNGIWSGSAWWNSPSGDGYRYILSKVPRLNGLGSEGTFRAYDNQWYSESDWKQSVDFVVWVQDNFLKGHPERYFSAACVTETLPSGATPEQVIKYGFCSMMLAAKYSSPQNTIDFVLDYSKNSSLLPLVQKLRNVDMSAPLGNFSKIGSTAVYGRNFVRGEVLVNPTATSYTITIDGSFTTIEGTIVSGALIVGPHTGVILFK